MTKPLTAEEAKNLTFPCLLEIWNKTRISMYDIVLGITSNDEFTSLSGANYANAALPCPEIGEAMKRQFEIKSEFRDKSLQNFNADEAQKMSVNNIPEKLYKYLSEIKKQAEKGERFLYVFEPLEDFTHLGLTSRGFTLIDHSNATIRTKELYCTIKW